MTQIPSIKISCENDHPTIRFAAEELQRYLGALTGSRIEVTEEGSASESILLSLEPADVADPVVDDAIDIDVQNGVGGIAGVNPRSVLLAVYRYLTELGCRWVRPGADGEFIPRIDALIDVKVKEQPSYRHRGICIEGSVSLDHVLDNIDWMPKVGFNGYFIQLREAYYFWDRWYGQNDGVPDKERTALPLDDARRYTQEAVNQIKKRDLLYHAVGHGWTCEPFGISGMGWETSPEPSDEVGQYLAQVNGERKLWGGIGVNTNLCYGNPKARQIVTEDIANYAEQNPSIDILHFWLADGVNNHCECELCRDTRPSDLYVRMLNDLDDLLTTRGLKTRVVFLIYVDLLWPPETEKIKNPDKFILMFAPITRTYKSSFAAKSELPAIPSYQRNKLEFPSSVEENVSFLRAWQKTFKGDSFDFDYHLWCDHFRDPGYTHISEILSQDIKALRDIGLNGIVSCQLQRTFFPTGMPMTVMGRTLWNHDLEHDDIAAAYFQPAYGPDGELVREYLAQLSELFDPLTEVSLTSAERLQKAAETIAAFQAVIDRNQGLQDSCWARSWEYLEMHSRITGLLAKAYLHAAQDEQDMAAQAWHETSDYIAQNQPRLHPALDVMMMLSVLGRQFRPQM